VQPVLSLPSTDHSFVAPTAVSNSSDVSN